MTSDGSTDVPRLLDLQKMQLPLELGNALERLVALPLEGVDAALLFPPSRAWHHRSRSWQNAKWTNLPTLSVMVSRMKVNMATSGQNQ